MRFLTQSLDNKLYTIWFSYWRIIIVIIIIIKNKLDVVKIKYREENTCKKD